MLRASKVFVFGSIQPEITYRRGGGGGGAAAAACACCRVVVSGT